jgi:hypothetical protein
MGMSPKRYLTFPVIALITTAALPGQSLMSGSGPSGLVRIFNTDSAVLESQEPRKDLPCSVSQIKPQLGFDMKFHAGYEVSIPLKDLAGSEDLLTTIFRVTPDNQKEDPVYFSQRISVPSIDPEANGNAYLQGYFDIGEGKYKVDFLIRDRTERVCSYYWDVEATLPPREKQVAMVIPPNTVAASEREQFKEEPPVERAAEAEQAEPVNIKVLVNFAPEHRAGTADREILDCRLQHAGAAGAVPAGGVRAHRLSGAWGRVEFAEAGHRGSEAPEPEARRHGVPDGPDQPGDEGAGIASGCIDLCRSEGDA